MAKTVDLIAEAARGGAAIIAFPEVWIPGSPHFLWLGPVAGQVPFVGRCHANALTVDGPEPTAIRRAARSHGITVALGYSEKSYGSLHISRTVIASDGSVLLHRRKLKPTHVERALFGEVTAATSRSSTPPGAARRSPPRRARPAAQRVRPVRAGRGTPHRLPALLRPRRDFAHQLSAEANTAATQVYAIEGGSFVLMATQVISPAGIDLFATTDEQRRLLSAGGGCSRIHRPDSRMITKELDEGEEGLVHAGIDLDAIVIAKNAYDPAGHHARPDATYLVHHREPRRAVVPGDRGNLLLAGGFGRRVRCRYGRSARKRQRTGRAGCPQALRSDPGPGAAAA
ncbi:nitrilase-related carbon-nitrogen hydrolase [Streptomyces sp. NBC_01314]|uniref:nitrilase-related carbon-nitrogen hydrolase n=1 Tax=Streptomyces sp. NBC_01314 TaxID=2903821 RepID=UPI00308E8AA0|nr:carbon-nitrogen hydrolase family protein [Streptomyces sp. NBC_01314]